MNNRIKIVVASALGFVVGLSSLVDAAGKKVANHEGEDMRRQDLSQLREDLRGANFRDAILSECKAERLDFTGATFEDANCEFAHFNYSNLTDADFRGALLTSTYFQYCKMPGANLEKQERFDATQVESLRGANLNGANVEGGAEATDFRDADLRNADLSRITYFPKARWRGAKYNARTIWMKGFNPENAGAVLVEGEDDDDDAPKSKKK